MNKLKYWRIKRGLTIRGLAEKAGVAIATVTRVENGDKAYSSTLGKLANALEIEFEELSEFEFTSPKKLQNTEA